MNRIVVIFVLLFFSIECYSGEAFFRPQSRKTIFIKEGDSFKGVIELWNIQNVSPEMILKIVGTSFLGNFYVISLEKPFWSENNPEVVIIKGDFILEKHLLINTAKWELGGVEIQVKIKEITTAVLKNKKKKLQILNGIYNTKKDSWKTAHTSLVVTLGLIIFVLAMKLREVKKMSFKDTLEKTEEVNWKELGTNAKNKKELSYIYENKRVWAVKNGINESALKDYVNLTEKLMFKKEIEDFEIDELKTSIDQVMKGIDS